MPATPETPKTAEPGDTHDIGPDASLLIVDDDTAFLRRLARAMETRGFAVETAETVAEGIAKSKANPPKHAVVDLRLTDGSGLDVIEAIRQRREDTRIIVLTGYGNIATAVTAGQMGAPHYLAQPPPAGEIYTAPAPRPGARGGLPGNPMSADRVRWEHIQRVYEMCERNVSETARRLNMHRRTLQRILAKRAPK